MSINNIEEHDAVEDTVVKTPSHASTASDDLLVVVPSEEMSIPSDDPSALDIETITKANTKFAVVSSNHNSIVDMKDVEDQIAAESAISKIHYPIIKNTFGQSVVKNMSIESFTSLPSKVNYSTVLVRMKLALEQESTKVSGLLADMFSDIKNDALQSLNRIREQYIPSCKQSIVANFLAMMVDAPNTATLISTGCFINIDSKPVNVVTACLSDVSDTGLSPQQNVADLHKAVLGLKAISQWPNVGILTYCMSNNVGLVDVVTDASKRNMAQQYVPCAKDMIELCATQKGMDFFASLDSFADSLIGKITSIERVDLSNMDDGSLKELDEQLHTCKRVIAACYYFGHIGSRVNVALPLMANYCK